MSTINQLSLEPRAFALCPASPQCPSEQRTACHCLLDHLGVQVSGNTQATSHLLALSDSKAVIDRARAELSSRGNALAAAASEADSALRRLETFVQQARILEACEEVTKLAALHANDGAHDRTRRLLPDWIADALIVLAAVFDTLFFGNLFRFLLNADTGTAVGRIAAVISYIPGVVLAFSLLICGLWLGEAVERRWIGRGRWPDAEKAPRSEWLLPLCFVTLVLVTVGAAAWVRPRLLQPLAEASELLGDSPGESAGSLPEWVIILLLMMLSITAIVAKIVSRNSYADHAEKVEKFRRRTQEEYRQLLTEAEQNVLTHEQRWQELRGSIFVVISDVEDLWAAEAWHRNGLTAGGPVAPNRAESRSDRRTYAPLVLHTPEPPPAFGAVLNAAHILDRYSVERTTSALARIAGSANGQWSSWAPEAAADGEAVE